MSAVFETSFQTTLAQRLRSSGTDTTILLSGVPDTVTAGVVKIGTGSNAEWVRFTGISTKTLTGCTRGFDKDATTITAATSTNKKDNAVGAVVKLVAHSYDLNEKANLDDDNIYTGDQTHTSGKTTFTSTTEAQLQGQSVTTTERNALTGVTNGTVVYDETLGVNYQYIAGAWSTYATGAVVNASATAAGKVELATDAEADAGTDTGGTSASLVVLPSQLRDHNPQTDLTAGENLTANNLAYVGSDGKVYKTIRAATAFDQIGSITSATTTQATQIADNKAVVCFGGSSLIKAVVLSYVEAVATEGAEVTLDATTSNDISVCKLDTDKFIAVYLDSNDSSKVYGTACTVSGTTITAGTPVKLYDTEAADVNETIYCCQLDTDKFLMTMRGDTSDDCIAVACTVSGTVITAGTGVAVSGAVTMTGATHCLQTYTDRAVVAYDDGTDYKVVPISVSGTTITTGTNKSIDTIANIGVVSNLFCGMLKISTNEFLIYNTASSSNEFFIYNLAYDSGAQLSDVTNISSFGITFGADASNLNMVSLGNNKIGVLHRQNYTAGDVITGYMFRVYERGVNSFREIFKQNFTESNEANIALAPLLSSGNKAALFMREGGGQTLNHSVYLDTSDQYIGVVKTTTTAASSAPIVTNKNAAQTGLTAGVTYYVGDAGAVATTGTKQIGVATSATNLYLK